MEGTTDKYLITEHYYLIEAVKSDNVEFLISYFEDTTKNVNDKLLYGYSGNTIFHSAVFYNSVKCVDYLLTQKYDFSNTNKDENSVIHIACLKGTYETVNKILKHGVPVSCPNKYGDTPLHSAVRSGSYNCVMLLLENGCGGCVSIKNKLDETPLHTACISKKKNFKIVELLVNSGSDVHNINSKDETILKSLSNEPKSIVREEIRTLLQRVYYNKFDKEDYSKLLNEYPEIRPFILDTQVDKTLDANFEDYEDNVEYKNLVTYDDNLRDNKLYVKKNTRGIKDKIDKKYFNNHENFSNRNSTIENTNEIIANKNKCLPINFSFIFLIFIIVIIIIFFIQKNNLKFK